MLTVKILVEGVTDEPVARKLVEHVGLQVGAVYGRNGKQYLLKRSLIYNEAARLEPWFVLIDLEEETQCPSEALLNWLPVPSKGMRFRIAVQAIEAWLMADRESIASFLGVALTKIPHQVDTIPDPKQKLINIARGSRNKSIREDIVPRQESKSQVGPLYVARLTQFTEKHWNPDEGAKHSASLRRCIAALSTLSSFKS